MPTKLIIDCETGVVSEVELTAEEIQQRDISNAAWAEEQVQREAQAAAQAAAKASAENKLASLGLTAEEVSALLGR